MKLYRSFYSLAAMVALRAYSFVISAVGYCLAKFDVAVEFAVAKVVATAKAVQHDAISFVSKVSVAIDNGSGRNFVSLRRSLDASA